MAGYTVGGGGQVGGSIDPDDQDRNEAYKKGHARWQAYQNNPAAAGGPADDGYGQMSPAEKEAYKRGHRGDE